MVVKMPTEPLGHPVRPPGMPPMMPRFAMGRQSESSYQAIRPSNHELQNPVARSAPHHAVPPNTSYPPRNSQYTVPEVQEEDPTYACLLCSRCGAVRVGTISLRPWSCPLAGSYHSYRVVRIGCEPHLSATAWACVHFASVVRGKHVVVQRVRGVSDCQSVTHALKNITLHVLYNIKQGGPRGTRVASKQPTNQTILARRAERLNK